MKNPFAFLKKIPKPIRTISLIALVAGLGVGSAIIVNQFFVFNSIDYSGYKISDFEDNHADIMRRYKSSGDLSKEAYLRKFKPYELATIGLDKVNEHESYHNVSIGEVTAVAGVKQAIRSYTIRNGNNYMVESISHSGIVSIAWRFYQDKDSVTSYEGTFVDIEKGNYLEATTEDYTYETCEEKWGRDFSRCCIYIISSKTTLNTSTASIEDGKIKVSLDLHPTYSVLRYVKQMKNISDLDREPTFKSVHIDFYLDEHLNLLSTEANEIYDVQSFGFTSKNTKGVLKDTYFYDDDAEIPALNEDCDYSKGVRV